MSKITEWQDIRLGDVVQIKHGWPFKSDCFCQWSPGRPVVVSIGNFQYTGGFRFETTQLKGYRGEYPKEYDLAPGDILLVMTCQTPGGEILGIPGRIPDDGQRYLHNQRMGKVVVTRPDLIDPDYLYWVFLWKEFNQELVASSSGTKIVHTAPTRIEAFRFSRPPLDEQRAIARILRSLDDKIELNRRMNRTLESMAQAIFRSWFVDFEPISSKREGRKPVGMDDATAALFPEHFQESSMGPIPVGWVITTIGEHLKTILGGTPSREKPEYWSGNIPWINSGMVNDFRVTAPSEYISEIGLQHSATKMMPKGTTLLAITGATLGKISRLEIEACGNQSIVGIIGIEDIPSDYIYLWMQNTISDLLARQTGAAQQHINKNDVNEHFIVLPTIQIMKRFSSIVAPVFKQISQNCFQQHTLATLRDSLLPQLLSGDLRIEQAEKMMGEA